MNEEEQPSSLADAAAAWIPPWQRAGSALPTGKPDLVAAELVEAESVEVETESGLVDVEPIDVEPIDADDVSESDDADEFDDTDEPDDADDPDEDVQQPETDQLDVVTGKRREDTDHDEGDSEEDDVQRPETDRLVEIGVAEDISPEAGVVAATLADTGAVGAGHEAPSLGGGVDAGRTPVSVESARPANLAGALEAILLVVDEPVSADVLAEVLEVSIDEATDALVELARGYADAGRGFDLRRAAGGWRFYTRGEYASYVERFVLDGQSVRLTQAALETLAVIAYQQPVTRSRMSAIRGVNCDGVVRTLANRGLIEECGTQPESGAFLYRTTPLFLEKLGLDSLVELPPLAPFLPDDVNGFADA